MTRPVTEGATAEFRRISRWIEARLVWYRIRQRFLDFFEKD